MVRKNAHLRATLHSRFARIVQQEFTGSLVALRSPKLLGSTLKICGLPQIFEEPSNFCKFRCYTQLFKCLYVENAVLFYSKLDK